MDYITQIDRGRIFSARSDASVEPGSENESRAISEQTAYIITNILTDVVQNGTGWRAKELGRPVAGKTGTSDDNRDAWFIGYTPVSYTHLRAHETVLDLVCRLLLEKTKTTKRRPFCRRFHAAQLERLHLSRT